MSDAPSLFDDPAATPETAPPEADVEVSGGQAAGAADLEVEEGDTLYLADAMALAYRAHFAFINRPLTNDAGMDTSAVYGFALSLLKLLEDRAPDHIAVVFDKIDGKPTFRDKLYEDYKAHRPPMPEELRTAIPYIKQLVEAFDIPVVEVEGVEADDVIGTLARRAEAEGVDVVIVSPDKDFRQLLSDRADGTGAVSMLRPAYRGEEFDLETADTFRETYGVEPIQFIDILALIGDSSDNVPGVRGIGKKTAPKLIADYDTVENLLEHAEEFSGKRVRTGLTEHAEEAVLSKRLVTILTDVELDLDWRRLRRTEPHMEAVHRLFDELGFGPRLRTRIRTYANGGSEDGTPDDHGADLAFDFGPYEAVESLDEESVDYETVTDADRAVEAVSEHLDGAEVLSVDTETTSTDPMEASLVGISLATQTGRAAYLPTPLPDGTQTEAVLAPLQDALTNPDLPKVGHNLKYDLLVLRRHGMEVRGDLFDTMVAHYLTDPEASHKMDDVASFHLNYKPRPITDLIGTGTDAVTMRDVPIEDVGPYACEDADVALRLVPVLREKLSEDGLLNIAETIEFPLVPVLAEMEAAGVKVSTAVLDDIRAELTAEQERLEAEIFEIAGQEFNVNSPQQLGEILFTSEDEGGLGFEVIEKTATGRPSTNERVLSKLATEHALPTRILDYRSVTKLLSTYVDKLPELIHPETGRIHTDFNQTVTSTGRLSSSNPNLQNIPVRTEMGREIRRAFVAEEGCRLMAADYAQIELRIIAHMSGDEGLTEAFREGRDIHRATAARVFDVDYDDVTRTQRDRVKQVNYGIPYGISAYGLAQRMRIPNAEAKALIEQYRASYPKVLTLLDDLTEQARENGYAETLRGRRRYLPQLGSRSRRDRAFAERVAVNMPIQGTQADMIKIAMVAIHRRLREEDLETRMILQVHDELVFEVPETETETVRELVIEEMQGAHPLDVPVEVEIGVADNWLDAH